jgi:hypothetical protein
MLPATLPSPTAISRPSLIPWPALHNNCTTRDAQTLQVAPVTDLATGSAACATSVRTAQLPGGIRTVVRHLTRNRSTGLTPERNAQVVDAGHARTAARTRARALPLVTAYALGTHLLRRADLCGTDLVSDWQTATIHACAGPATATCPATKLVTNRTADCAVRAHRTRTANLASA